MDRYGPCKSLYMYVKWVGQWECNVFRYFVYLCDHYV